MGIDLYAKKGKIELSFGRAHQYNIPKDNIDFEGEIESIEKDEEKTIEKIKGLAKYNPKDIDDMYRVEEDLGNIIVELLDGAQRLGCLMIFKDLKDAKFKFIEE